MTQTVSPVTRRISKDLIRLQLAHNPFENFVCMCVPVHWHTFRWLVQSSHHSALIQKAVFMEIAMINAIVLCSTQFWLVLN